jgi:hypothetical protein
VPQGAGRPWADAEAAATASHPDLAEEIAAYRPHWGSYSVSCQARMRSTAARTTSTDEANDSRT